MKNYEYNGWTNYATWRINLEILDDIDYEQEVTADYLEEITEDIVFNNTVDKGCLAADYARAFLHDVNYHEIASHINDELNRCTRNMGETCRNGKLWADCTCC
tara:strand:- start:171 stop:479 length:309 start_codon:yes stop_codon:yes gene_type:complete